MFGIGETTNSQLGENNKQEKITKPTLRPLQIKDKILENHNIERIYSFFDHVVFICEDGCLFSMGHSFGHSDSIGMMPIDDAVQKEISGHRVIEGSISGANLLLLYSNHKVYCLGDASRFGGPTRNQLVKVSNEEEHGNIIHISMGYSISYFLNDKHQVFSFGDSSGSGRDPPSKYPVNYSNLLDNDEYIVKLTSGYAQVVALTNKGKAIFHGYGSHGEGADQNVSSVPQIVKYFQERNIKLVDASCGIFHTMWLSNEGKLYNSGRNTDAQLGVAKETSNSYIPLAINSIPVPVVEVQAGGSSSLALSVDNRIYFAGSFYYLNGVDDIYRDMEDLMDILKRRGDPSDVELFGQYYNDPSYEKAISPGSAHFYIMFKQKRTAWKRLYQASLDRKLTDIDICTVW
jgi:alpha-tubulin suppressor-like RCC1 family protein